MYPVAKHLCTPPHIGVADMSVTALVSVQGGDNNRHFKEQSCIFQLGTLVPAGINALFDAFPLAVP